MGLEKINLLKWTSRIEIFILNPNFFEKKILA